jgi:signal transduction histidine kinase
MADAWQALTAFLRRALRLLSVRVALVIAGATLLALLALYGLLLPSLQSNLAHARLDALSRAASRPEIEESLSNVVDTSITPPGDLEQVAQQLGARVYVYTAGPPPLFYERASGSPPLTRTPVVVRRSMNAQFVPFGEVTTLDGTLQAVVAISYVTRRGTAVIFVFADPLGDVRGAVSLVQRRLFVAGLVGLALAMLVGWGVAVTLSRRLGRLRHSAERISHGRFDEPVQDLSGDEVGELARSFETMRVRLARLDRTRNEFIANASHELRTPLTSLGGFLDLVREGELDPATRDEFLGEMRQQVDRLTKLASDLLDLSRLDAGSVELAREEIDLEQLAADAVREAGPLARRRGLDLRLRVDGGGVVAVGDEARVRQVLRALVDNALRHNPAGTKVVVAAGSEGGSARLHVSDDGVGIPPEAGEQVFDRFFRGPGAAAAGSGLGLAIARELALRMGGTLTLDARPGSTVFALGLELAPVREAEQVPA